LLRIICEICVIFVSLLPIGDGKRNKDYADFLARPGRKRD